MLFAILEAGYLFTHEYAKYRVPIYVHVLYWNMQVRIYYLLWEIDKHLRKIEKNIPDF